jgi:signal transduction histidine kinase
MVGNGAPAGPSETLPRPPRGGRPGRANRWLGLRPPRPPTPSPELLQTLWLALSLTDHAASQGPPIPPSEALRRLRAARDEFVGLVSHELRTPVTTIYGNARLLLEREDGLDRAVRPMVMDIVQDAERLLYTVENLLLLTRDRGEAPDDREPLQLVHVLRGACRSFERRHRRRVTIQADAGPRVVVEVDRAHLGLLMENLLGNADKFSLPDRPIEVVVEAADGEAHVTILDRGVGLGAVSAEELFAPFYRGSVARRVSGGMGLGLAVAKRIVESEGGRLWARSRPDGGAAFGFSLPLLPDPGP